MNDTPGWASPGSAPSDGKGTEVPRPSAPADDAPSGTWAAEQPPAGQWTPPGPTGAGPTGAGPTAPPPRPGAHTPPQGPGWGGSWQGPGWGGPPPAAKPGVIPLRPLGVGEILDGAVSTMRAHWRTVLGITLTVSVIAQTAILFIRRYLLPDPRRSTPTRPARRPCASSTSPSATTCSTAPRPCSSRCSPRSSPQRC